MQDVANEMNLAETAFLLQVDDERVFISGKAVTVMECNWCT